LILGALVDDSSREAYPLPWRYMPLAFDGGGITRVAYLIIAADEGEICVLGDRRTAHFVCAADDLLKKEKPRPDRGRG
jgi:hypothetical protein